MTERKIAVATTRLYEVRATLADLQSRREMLAREIAALDTSPIPSAPDFGDVRRANARVNFAYALADFDRQIAGLTAEQATLVARLAALQA
jgi:hypothetical protein